MALLCSKSLSKILLFVAFIISLSMFSFSCFAKQNLPKICMVLDKGGRDDHSFNESAVKGFQLAQKALHINPESRFVEPKNDAQLPLFLNNFSSEVNCDLIIAIGFTPAAFIPEVASKFPQKKFMVIDSNLQLKNVKHNIRSVLFEEHEGSFLVGAIAAIKSKTGRVGFVGGMDVPLIHRFALGYSSGAKYINPNIKVQESYVGVTPDAWNNPSKAKELALSQYNKGVDVIFQVAAASGQGVFDAAEELNKSDSKSVRYAIGVDSNQNWVNPHVILTSMEKRVDRAVFNGISDFISNKFTADVVVYGLKDSGVNWSLDNNNREFYSPSEIARINLIKKLIIDHVIHVPDYYKINTHKN